MKSIIIKIFVGLLFFTSCNDLSSDTYWIATDSWQISNQCISPLDGMIINFNNDSVEIRHVFYDSTQKYSLKIRNKEIYFDGTIWGKINYKNKDSLLIDFNNNMRVKFSPLTKGLFFNHGLEFWNYTDWEFLYNDSCQDFKLLDRFWGIYPNNISKICVTQTKGNRYKYFDKEKWNVVNVNGNHIFVITYMQSDFKFYNVIDYNNDTATLKNITYQDTASVFLIKKAKISEKEEDKIIKIIQNKRWSTAKLLDNANSFDEDTNEWKYDVTGFFLIDTTIFKKISLQNNNLSFEFTDRFVYNIYEANTLRVSGKWRLSNTGKQIVLNNACNPDDYIDIIEIKQDSLTIGKLDKFQVGKRKRDFVEFYYKLILTD